MDRLRLALGLAPGNVFLPYVVGSLVVAALATAVLPAALIAGVPPVYAWSLGLTLLAVALVFVVVFAVAAAKEASQVTALLTGETWARWSYPAADEERLAAAEWTRTTVMVRQTVGSALLAGTIVGGTMAVSGLGLAPAVVLGGGIAGFLLLIGLVVYLRGRRRYERRRSRSREVVFGPMAVLHNGACVQLWGRKIRLEAVAVEPTEDGDAESAPASVLRFDRLVERRSTTSTSSDWWWLELLSSHRYWAKVPTTVPIPTGRDAEAEALAERYRHRYGLDGRRERGSRPASVEPRAGLAVRAS